MPTVLSDLERNILDYMVQYLRTNTYQPSIREIGEHFDIKSTKTVSEHLRALADKGYLERDPSRSRGVRILGVDLNPQTVSVPCYLALPDSRTGYSSDGVEGYYSFDRRMAGPKGSYFVRARGDEYQGVGVEAGDFLLIEPVTSRDIRIGDLVVVLESEGARLFRYARNGNGHLLSPADAGRDPLPVESTRDVEVTGRVAALFRSFDSAPVPISQVAH